MASQRLSTRTALIALAAVAALFASACSSDDSRDDSSDGASPDTAAAAPDDTGSTASTTAAEEEVLRLMVTNDDGVMAEGIDAVVEGLSDLDGVEVTVVAPADEKSGSGNKTTDGDVATEDATTISGYPSIAVDGFPADTVNWAFDGGLDATPHLVVSGINSVPNVGPAVVISGTVGAARTAAGRGVPAIATSQGFPSVADGEVEYEVSVEEVLAWVKENRDALLAVEPVIDSGEVEFVNFNSPSCGDTGTHKGPLEVPLGTTGPEDPSTDCSRDLEPTNDIEAMLSGWTAFTILIPSTIEDTPEG